MKAERRNGNRLHPRYSYRLCLVTGAPASRERIPVGHGYSSNRGHKIAAEKINAWLGVADAPVGRGPRLQELQTVATAPGLGRASAD